MVFGPRGVSRVALALKGLVLLVSGEFIATPSGRFWISQAPNCIRIAGFLRPFAETRT